MRILSWVQKKLNGNQEKKTFDAGSCSSRRTSGPDPRRDEFSDWPQSLLSIGTFGNTELKEDPQQHDPSENSDSVQDLPDFSLEEVMKLKKELTKLLRQKPKSSTDGSEMGGDRASLPLNRFLNCPSSLEVDRRDCLMLSDDLSNGENDGDLSPNSKIILSKARDILADKHNAVRQRSFTFLLKKMFACKGGFAPAPSLRDPLLQSRMDKLLRVALQKKIYPRNSNAMSVAKKYLEKKPMERIGYKDKMKEKEEDGHKWVKTDSEYIVLEM